MVTRNQVDNSLSGSSGTGSFVGSSSAAITSPTFSSPALGTPASGNLINCTGAYWGSQSGTPIGMQFASGNMNAAAINTLRASPVQIVAGAGANLFVMPIYFVGHYIYGTTPFTAAAAQTIRLTMGSGGTRTLFNSVVSNAVLVGSANGLSFGNTVQQGDFPDASALNVGIYFVNTQATEITGGDSSINWYIWYMVFDTTI